MIRRQLGRWARTGAFALVGAGIAVGGVNASGASAHLSTGGQYAHVTSSCAATEADRTDPVMDVFYNNATSSNVASHVQHHTGWTNQTGSNQWWVTHTSPSFCLQNASSEQRAIGCGTCDRYHVRFKQTYHGDATWGITALATPHEEIWLPAQCHVVTSPYGYQNGRTIIYNSLVANGGHAFAGSSYWGNTQLQRQCDGAASSVRNIDGRVDFVRIP